MKGRYEIVVQNRRLHYRFTIERNVTILRGDSATGKTTLINMISDYQRLGKQSGVTVVSDKPCVVLTAQNWQLNLTQIQDSIIFIDEGEAFVRSKEFAEAIQNSGNYYVIATRASLFNIPYSIREIYGIKNKAGNRYQGTKRLYAEFIQLYKKLQNIEDKPDLVIVEDTNAGFEFFSHCFERQGIRCVSAKGKSNIFGILKKEIYSSALIIADGAAFGAEIERIIALKKAKKIRIYLPEFFEWMILKADLLKETDIKQILENPSSYIESLKYISWERYFTALLIERSQNTYLQYNKSHLNPNYLHKKEETAIQNIIKEIDETIFL